jgi:thioredoxin reductase
LKSGGPGLTHEPWQNYLGFPAGISGGELAARATIQARKFGAELTVPGEGSALDPGDGCFRVQLSDGESVIGTEWLRGRLALDDGGYILTGDDAAAASGSPPGANGSRRSELPLETSLRGVFAAGDVRSGSTPRVSSAVGDGANAIREAYEVLHGRLHIVRLAHTYVSSK